MGLTISYTLTSKVERPEDARSLVEKLRDRASELSFKEVGEILELQGRPAYDHKKLDRNDPLARLKIHASNYLQYSFNGEKYNAWVPPDHLIAFTIHPGNGCALADFGLCSYAETITDDGRRVATNLQGWQWQSFCKTQYASNPNCGGLPNFLHCHVGLVKLLDYAAELGILARVVDEGGYWKNRDAAALVKQIEHWNQMMAGAVGQMKDTLEKLGEGTQSIMAEIVKFPNFEHLEAKGRNE